MAAPAPAAVEDSVDPWDEPADAVEPQPADAAPAAPAVETERPSSDLLVDVGTADEEVTAAAEEATASDAVTPAPAPGQPEAQQTETEQTETQAAEKPTAGPTGFTGDAALLDEPDPWD